jgi:hypothetical protein
MSDLGDLLELMHTASMRYNTVRAIITHSTDSGLWYESARRWQAVMPQGSMEIVSLGEAPVQDSRTTVSQRLWYAERGRRWRLEGEDSLDVSTVGVGGLAPVTGRSPMFARTGRSTHSGNTHSNAS